MKKFISGIARKLLLLYHAFSVIVLVLSALLLPATDVNAATVTWLPTGGTNDWFVGTNWSSSTAPTNGDEVIITNTVAGNNFGVLLTNPVGYFSSVLLSNKCTLIFSNWNTSLSATNVTILSNGVLTLPAAFTNNQMSNSVYIICSNLTVATGGRINVNGQGYAGGPSASLGAGSGPGGGAYGGNGGGYGGMGGGGATGVGGGVTNGLPETPLYPGSGGGWWNAAGTAGGGLIRIEADGGAVQLDGLMSANGLAGSGGGGSGGGIYIQCKTFTGGGSLSAIGGSSTTAGGGGGGRIAVIYDLAAQSAVTNPTGVFSTAGGSGTSQGGDVGTLYFPDTRFLSTTMHHTGQWLSLDLTNWSMSNLLLTNSWLRFRQEGFRLTVTGDVVMVGASRLDIGANAYRTIATIYYQLYNTGTAAPVFSVGGNVSMATGCTVYLYGALTNATTTDYGLLMNVTGDVSIASNAWIYIISHYTNGGSPLFRMSNLVVTTGGGFNANGLGYAGAPSATIAASGPGRGGYGGGGGAYGGYGGSSGAGGGYVTSMPYGVSNTPLYAGSGGGWWNAAGGAGGGVIRIEAADAVQMDGSMSANGVSAVGGGSGGGIYVRARRFAGTTGSLTANGGAGSTGGGGGGRIAVWRIYHTYSGSASVTNGTTVRSGATVGTIVWEQLPIPGTVFTIH